MTRKGNVTEKRARQELLTNWDVFLLDPATITILEGLTPLDFTAFSANMAFLLESAAIIWSKKSMTVDDFFQSFNDAPAMQNRNPSLQKGHQIFMNLYRNFHKKTASHWEKRDIVKQLGLCQSPFSITELLRTGQYEFNNIKLIKRSRKHNHGIKRHIHMSEIDRPGVLVVNEKTGYYVVNENESVIFYSTYVDEAGDEQVIIELVVIRGIAQQAPFASSLYAWLASVVKQACSDRRNVRPTHPGRMAQVGMNLGPRHARVLGWAKSFTKKLDSETMVECDLDAIGALSITWSLVQSIMPSEILKHVDKCLEEVGLPRLATRNVEEGHGFHIMIDNNEYLFPTAERAPPEGYLSHGYEAWTHTDKAYCTYAFALCPDRQVPEPNVQPFAGSSFVDIGLEVVVRHATGTMMAFQPEYLHGTTMPDGAVNMFLLISFSRRVSDAWEDAQKLGDQVHVVANEGVVEET